MSLDNRIKEGTKVLIVGSFSSNSINRSDKSRFIGHTAKVENFSRNPKDPFPYNVIFDEKHIEDENHWRWAKDEIIYLEDQSYVR